MTWTINTKSKRHPPAALAAGLAISAFLALGTFVGSAGADEHHGGGGRGGGHAAYHGGGYGGGYSGWSGGYYGAPPVVYGGPLTTTRRR